MNDAVQIASVRAAAAVMTEAAAVRIVADWEEYHAARHAAVGGKHIPPLFPSIYGEPREAAALVRLGQMTL